MAECKRMRWWFCTFLFFRNTSRIIGRQRDNLGLGSTVMIFHFENTGEKKQELPVALKCVVWTIRDGWLGDSSCHCDAEKVREERNGR